MDGLPAPFCVALALIVGPPAAPPGRAVAVTFDDLPVVSVLPLDPSGRDALTSALLGAIRRHHVPAIGFVNENKLADSAGTLDPSRVALLQRWLDAGLELGNHTWSHPDLHRIPLAAFEAEILRGEAVTRQLLAERGRAPRYFRHPFLHTGRSVAVRDSLTAFLAAHGYRVAPVTIDNADYSFAAAYDRALAGGDREGAARVRSTYLEYMDSVAAFYERQSLAILGRELPQVLLLHANRLNAEAFDAVATMFERRGYRFIPLDEALADRAYGSPDTYTGPAGITWLHRWAMTAGTSPTVFRGEPEVPDWITAWAGGTPPRLPAHDPEGCH
jgi:peptidoglycan/xylan/chitin deacetylase (PgdA/CDA1 family)